MTSFATVDDLATYMGHEVDTARAEMLLAGATAAIKSRTSQLIERGQSTTRLRVVQDQVTLLERPVVSVDEVRRVGFDGSTSSPITGFIFDGVDKLYGANRLTWIVNLPEVWIDEPYPMTVEVTYTHGFDTIPDDLKEVCLARAQRAYELPSGGALMQEQVGDYMYRVNETFMGKFTEPEIAIMKTYTRVARTVAIR